MKKIKLVYFIALAISIISCSSDSDGGSSVQTALTVNGSPVTLSNVFAQKSERTMSIYATGSDDSSIEIVFNQFGDLESVSYDDAEFNSFYNYQYYKSNYFTFNIVSLNEANNTIKVSYSGTLYSDETDLNSESVNLSGSFDTEYINQTPLIAGIGLSCKINGQDWYETDFWDNGFSDVDRKYISDDENMIIMNLTEETIETGTYSFTNNSQNKIGFAKFNTTTKEYDFYQTTGTLTITSNTVVSSFVRIIEGTFSLTATNGSSSIQVTSGTFKTNF
ncbi:DUF6252 family protein [Flavobacterium macrobrachii]|jgi:hypothetical protein|uniref:DUF6252 family protein n=1 Tax=Flavobacterium macrobrachii TaxID=591204 RepID=UPI0037BF3826